MMSAHCGIRAYRSGWHLHTSWKNRFGPVCDSANVGIQELIAREEKHPNESWQGPAQPSAVQEEAASRGEGDIRL